MASVLSALCALADRCVCAASSHPFRGSSGNKLHCADGIVARGKNESVYFIVASFKSKGRRFGVLENLFLSAFRVCIEIVLFIEVP